MDVKHTPGPWTIGRTPNPRAMDRGGKPTYSHVEYALLNVHVETPEEADANCRLMMAAPELLEALRACAARLEMAASDARGRHDAEDARGYDAIAGRTRAAIAKAEGK